MNAPSSSASADARALLGLGQVRHERLRPQRNAFAYPAFFLMLPMRAMRLAPLASSSAMATTGLPRNRFGLISFHDKDHGDGGPDSLQWLETVLRQEGVNDADGEVWLQCFPRVLGWAFKPVSFWLCERKDKTLAAVLAEVNNTFGERHFYLLQGPDLAWGRECVARKVFHVSPFCEVLGHYQFRFMRSADGKRFVARVVHHDADGELLRTSVSGELAPCSRRRIGQAMAQVPWQSVSVVARIHWQALRLWWAGVPFFGKPAPPADLISHSHTAAAAIGPSP